MSHKVKARDAKLRKLSALAKEMGFVLLPQKEGVGQAHQLERLRRDVKESKVGEDHVDVWNRHWKGLCTLPDGSLDLDGIQRELCDYAMLLAFVPRVYEHVTGGMITKPNTWPSVVCSVADDHISERLDWAAKEAVDDYKEEHWKRDDEALYDMLLLVGHDVPIGVMPGWTNEQAKQAEDWASAAHFSASDNDVRVPQRPDFLAPFEAPASYEVVSAAPVVPAESEGGHCD